jgi:hypothetical protein
VSQSCQFLLGKENYFKMFSMVCFGRTVFLLAPKGEIWLPGDKLTPRDEIDPYGFLMTVGSPLHCSKLM